MNGFELVQVDAFTSEPFRGNPAAVCILGAEPPATWMQSMAAEMNLSETAFVWVEDGGWRLRWFTPVAEVRLCGHATLAAAHALWETERSSSSSSTVRFHTRAGVLKVHRETSPAAYRLALPRIDLVPLEDVELSRSTETGPMKGLVFVDPAGLASERDLAFWTQMGVSFVSRLPPK